METKKTESLDGFIKGVESLKEELLTEGKGYMLLTYEELENTSQVNAFSFSGKLSHITECLYSCMRKNEILANVVIAAANALVHNRIAEAQAIEEKVEGKKKSKKTKKIS